MQSVYLVVMVSLWVLKDDTKLMLKFFRFHCKLTSTLLACMYIILYIIILIYCLSFKFYSRRDNL